MIRSARLPGHVASLAFAEPFHDHFALIIRRGAQLSPGTLAFIELGDGWARTLAAQPSG